jgi:hypothetical protein
MRPHGRAGTIWLLRAFSLSILNHHMGAVAQALCAARAWGLSFIRCPTRGDIGYHPSLGIASPSRLRERLPSTPRPHHCRIRQSHRRNGRFPAAVDSALTTVPQKGRLEVVRRGRLALRHHPGGPAGRGNGDDLAGAMRLLDRSAISGELHPRPKGRGCRRQPNQPVRLDCHSSHRTATQRMNWSARTNWKAQGKNCKARGTLGRF